ncbi:hypothetical protein [Lewinella sp. W8]|uniref:hypothetical protein n=1 Tax=Lewinella sp. W8 TaxID=2528208 RepID=UPI00106849DA|nr:hypothetical protein [Lewinella sp. W8]MTB50943.1 hypothetical protein [Lewinella sp. W8]
MRQLQPGWLLLFAFLLTSPALSAGPWPPGKGKGYYKLYEWWIRFDEHYSSTGELDPNATIGLYNTTIFATHGFSDRLTGVMNLPLFSRSTINNQVSGTRGNIIVPGDEINTIGDAELGIRYALSSPGAKWPVAVGLTLGLPLGEAAGGELGNLQTGDGEFNQLIYAETGTSVQLSKSTQLYSSVMLGVNNRSGGFSDEFRYGMDVGVGLSGSKLWIIGRLQGSESFFNGETAETTTSTSIFSNNAEYLSLGGEINYYLTDRLGLSAGAATAISGRIIAAAPAFSLGIFIDTTR